MSAASQSYEYNEWLLAEVRHRAKKASPQWREIYDAADDRIVWRLCDLQRQLTEEHARRLENSEAAREFAYALRMDR